MTEWEKADKMDDMLLARRGTDDNYEGWLKAFCERKWNSEFSVEMSRSSRKIIDSWCKKD